MSSPLPVRAVELVDASLQRSLLQLQAVPSSSSQDIVHLVQVFKATVVAVCGVVLLCRLLTPTDGQHEELYALEN